MPKGIYVRTEYHKELARKKIALYLGTGIQRIGKHHSQETKNRISFSKLGGQPWNKNKICPQLQGAHCHLYKGGISRVYKNGYYSPEYRQWRKSVFLRDNFKCQKCGAVKTYVTAHHIKSFAKFPDLRFELSNGVTLCEDCHSLVDKYRARFKKRSA